VKVFTEIFPISRALRLDRIVVVAVAFCLLLGHAQAKTNCAHSVQTASCAEQPTVTEEVMHGKTFIVSRLLIKACPERVWQILADYNNAARVFPILKECELLQDKGTTKITRHVLAPSGIPDTFEYVLEIHETAPCSMEWHRISGDFHDVDGYWKLEPVELGRQTMVTYASYCNGGILIPQFLIRRQFKIDMPNALIALRNKAELDTRIAAHRGGISTQ
jgi:ribosome-associated toxin RatA of RatAB toxin-antitoxin module